MKTIVLFLIIFIFISCNNNNQNEKAVYGTIDTSSILKVNDENLTISNQKGYSHENRDTSFSSKNITAEGTISVYKFSSGLAIFNENGKDGFINTNGEVEIPAKYDGVGNFSEGLAYVIQNGRYGYIDVKDHIVIPIKYHQRMHRIVNYLIDVR